MLLNEETLVQYGGALEICDGTKAYPVWNTPQRLGLSVIHDPRESNLDIVLVHGFSGDSVKTWSFKEGKEYTSTKSNTTVRSKAEVYWPYELLSRTAPTARIITFGYDTKIRHFLGPAVSVNALWNISGNLVKRLEAIRRDSDTAKKPLLFIAHSLGGLVVKQALQICAESSSKKQRVQICEATIGVVFFGTPHSGAEKLGLIQRVGIRCAQFIGFRANAEVIDLLLRERERLLELRESFLTKREKFGWRIQSFQEEYPLFILGWKKVVTDSSSAFYCDAFEDHEHISRNHMDMCRFAGLDDAEYDKLATVIRRFSQIASKHHSSAIIGGRSSSAPSSSASVPSPRFEHATNASGFHSAAQMSPTRGSELALEDHVRLSPGQEEDRIRLIDILRFREMFAREDNVESPHLHTCGWFLQTSELRNWIDEVPNGEQRKRILWLRGKAGAGKSTLLKFVRNKLAIKRDHLVVSFFFTARGLDIQGSVVGMYRSLLVQLLQKRPEIATSAAQEMDQSADRSTWRVGNNRITWSIERLKIMLLCAIESLGNIQLILLIDALDESSEKDIRDMVDFFSELVIRERSNPNPQRKGIKLLLSSRPYPHIFSNECVILELEKEDGHKADIRDFIRMKLNDFEHLDEQEKQVLGSTVESKALGIFLWVVLVLKMLRRAHDHGSAGTVEALLERLDRVSELNAGSESGFWGLLFRDLLTRNELDMEQICVEGESQILTYTEMDQCRLCFQWVLFSKRPLRPEELYFAVQSGSPPNAKRVADPVREWQTEFRGERVSACNINTMIKFLTSRSKGLVQLMSSRDGDDTVQFIHGTVRDYFLKWDGVSVLFPGIPQEKFIGLSHERLRDCCDFAIQQLVRQESLDEEPEKKFADKGLDERIKMLRSISKCFNFLLYAVAFIFHHSDTALSQDVLQSDFLRRFSLDTWFIVAKLVETVDEASRPNNDLHTIEDYLLLETTESDSFFNCVSSRTVLLHILASMDTPYLMKAVLEDHSVMLRMHEKLKKQELKRYNDGRKWEWIIEKWNSPNWETMFNDPLNALDRNDCTPLGRAVSNRSYRVVRMLITFHGKEVQSVHQSTPSLDHGQGKPIGESTAEAGGKRWSGSSGNKEPSENGMSLLSTLVYNIYPNARDGNKETILGRACLRADAEAVKLLVQAKSDVMNLDLDAPSIGGGRGGFTPLLRASANENSEMARLLLLAGADPNKVGCNEMSTPLIVAATSGQNEVVRLLLAGRNVDVNARNSEGVTPLIGAASTRHDQVRLSLTGPTPGTYARRVDVVRQLLAENADPEAQDENGTTALMGASSLGYQEIVEQVLAQGQVEPDRCDKLGNTALIAACVNGKFGTVQMLINTGKVDPHIHNLKGESPLSIARMGLQKYREDSKRALKFRVIVRMLEREIERRNRVVVANENPVRQYGFNSDDLPLFSLLESQADKDERPGSSSEGSFRSKNTHVSALGTKIYKPDCFRW